MMNRHGLVPVLLAWSLAAGCGFDASPAPQPTRPAPSPSEPQSAPREANRPMTDSDYEVAEAYAGLRGQVLRLRPDMIGLADVSGSHVVAVLIETGFPEAVASLVAVADGTASIYFSNGGGIIGAGTHEPVAEIAREVIAAAQPFVSQAARAEESPIPAEGRVRFYLVTGEGVYTMEAAEEDLGNNRHAFSPLYHEGHRLITAIREHSPQ